MHAADNQPAAYHLRRALKLDPSLRLAQLDLGIVLVTLGDAAEAEAEFAKVRKLRQKQPQNTRCSQCKDRLGNRNLSHALVAATLRRCCLPERDRSERLVKPARSATARAG